MPFVIFDSATGEIQKAGHWTTESVSNELAEGLQAGEVEEIAFEGAIKNYVFIPQRTQTLEAAYPKGTVARKPPGEWDLQAEEDAANQKRIQEAFHRLDMKEVASLEVHLLLPSRFRNLPNDRSAYTCTIDEVNLTISLTRRLPIPVDASFAFGGYTIASRQTELAFRLSGHEPFLKRAVEAQCGGLAPDVFVSTVIRRESLKCGLRAANLIIECYRVAYSDPEEAPVGVADSLAGAVTVCLRSGAACHYHSGISVRDGGLELKAKGNSDNARMAMEGLLARGGAPFIPIAISELRKARIHGQFRECLVWAATIISTVIETVLREKLPTESPEYKRLVNEPSKVRGETRRNAYFKKATGYTLAEFLEGRTGRIPYKDPIGTWGHLAKYVEKLLDDRNLMLHRRKAIGPMEGEVAFATCMNFLHAIQEGIPYLDNLDQNL